MSNTSVQQYPTGASLRASGLLAKPRYPTAPFSGKAVDYLVVAVQLDIVETCAVDPTRWDEFLDALSDLYDGGSTLRLRDGCGEFAESAVEHLARIECSLTSKDVVWHDTKKHTDVAGDRPGASHQENLGRTSEKGGYPCG